MFLYKFLVGENHKIVFIDPQKSQFKFNGEYERNILCQNCDSIIIGKLDDYFAKFSHGEFSTKLTPRFEKMEDKDVVVIEDYSYYDYSKYKLFLLSLLWRASISSRPFFKQIKLPEEIEDDLRQKILNSQPGEPDEYPCFINLPPIMTDSKGRTGLHTFYMPTISPTYLEKDKLKMCEFIIEGIHFYFIISKPHNMKVEPAIKKDKLTIAFSTYEDQEKLIYKIMGFMKEH